MNQQPKQQRPSPPKESPDEHDSFVESDHQQPAFQAPEEQQRMKVLYEKYLKNESAVIAQVDETQKSIAQGNPYVFKIKNLDTGQEMQINDDEQGESYVESISKDISQIDIEANSTWEQFWKKVVKSSEKLRYYSEIGRYDEAQTLLKLGEEGYPVQANYKGMDDWAPIHYAAYEGHDDIIQLLLEHGANVNALAKFNRNALHIASLRGQINVVKKLCKNKINFNAVDVDGNTALHFAAENSYKDIVQYLLSIYCKIIKNKEGLTPIDDCVDQAIKQIFQQQGYKAKDKYETYSEVEGAKIEPINKFTKKVLKENKLTPDDFVYYKMLGKGSFGEVFLVRKKAEMDQTKFYAMKVLSKDKIMGKNLKRYALTERNVMSCIDHPFMVKLFFAFQTPAKLFLVMDYYPGGDLGHLISRKKSLPELEARKYVCEITLAFQALHKNMIIFRDLKPDNVVIDSEGHCRLTDFGLSKQGIYNNVTDSFCGSIAYLAPQILTKQGHSRTVDWYLLGLVLYELIVGLPPYYNSKKDILFQNIKRGPLKIPKSMSAQAKDLIKKLLCRDPRRRLGNSRDSEEIKQHPFFQGIDWQQVLQRKLQMAPIQPPKININDTVKISFNSASQQAYKSLEGWTFIGK